MRRDCLHQDAPLPSADPLSTPYCPASATTNQQPAARSTQHTASMYLGDLFEFNRTDNIFTAPANTRTQAYVTGRFG